MTKRRSFLKLAAGMLPGVVAADDSAPHSDFSGSDFHEEEGLGRCFPSDLKLSEKLTGVRDLSVSATGAAGKSTYDRYTAMTASHWGIAKVRVSGGKIERLDPIEEDLAPSVQLQSFGRLPYDKARIRYPMVRKSFLKKGYQAGGGGRGREPFVRVSWDTAIKLVASEIKRVQLEYGSSAIYGGTYGWKSTGALGNASNLAQRMLNVTAGGFTGNYGDYSTACAQVILPYVIGSNGVYEQVTSWDLICKKTKLIVLWGCDPTITNDIDWSTTVHGSYDGLSKAKELGIPFVAVNPVKPDTAEFVGDNCKWIAPRPGTDAAMMAAMCRTLIKAGCADDYFMEKYTVGYEEFKEYLSGDKDGVEKTASWAEEICGVPAQTITDLALAMRRNRSMIMGGWGAQRAQYGEQFHWMLVALAAMCGHIGKEGGGFGFTYHYCNGGGPTTAAPQLCGISSNPAVRRAPGLPWTGAAQTRIPLSRFTDCFLNPGKTIDYNGMKITYPEIQMVYWAGGNPFSHQEDINRLLEAWKKPEVTVVTDIVWTATARHADIVLPACTSLERNDISNIGSYSNVGIVAMHQAIEPQYESLSDFEICRRIAAEFGREEVFTEGKDEMGWIRSFYEEAAAESAENGYSLPTFDDFWKRGLMIFPVIGEMSRYNYFGDFIGNPILHPLGTESGKIEIFSKKIASFRYPDCPPHPTWLEPTEWLGGAAAKEYPFALITSAGRYRLHSQLDSAESRNYVSIDGREPVWIHPGPAASLGIENGDIVKVSSKRGSILCGAVLTERVREDVVVVRHGAWYCPQEPGKIGSLDLRGCDNVLTGDIAASNLSCGNVANSWLVKVEKYDGPLDEVYVWDPPETAEL